MDAVHKLRGKKGTKVTITVVREDEDDPIDFDIVRDIIEIKSVKHKIYHEDIGYIRISSFQGTTADELDKALKEIDTKDVPLKGLVLDLRNNPGGLLNQSVKVSDMFLKSGVIVSSKGRAKDSEHVYTARDDGYRTPMSCNYPDQRRNRQCGGDCIRSASRQQEGCTAGHSELWKGIGTDHCSSEGWFGSQTDDRKVLYACRGIYPGQGNCS